MSKFSEKIRYLLLVELRYRLLAKFGTEAGVTKEKRDPPVIVSLTTFSDRLHKVFLCIESLLRQSVKPDRLILWLEEPDGEIPASLKRLQRRGLEIKRCKCIRSYAKIIYTLKEFPMSVIVTCDDDYYYPRDWLRDLLDAYRREPKLIHCYRAHLMEKDARGGLKDYNDWQFKSEGLQGPSMLLFPTGVSGVLYPPGSLDEEVINEDIFMSICPTSDDVWLKAMSLLRGVACKKVSPSLQEFIKIRGTQERALGKINMLGKRNDEQIKEVFEYYKIYQLIDSYK